MICPWLRTVSILEKCSWRHNLWGFHAGFQKIFIPITQQRSELSCVFVLISQLFYKGHNIVVGI